MEIFPQPPGDLIGFLPAEELQQTILWGERRVQDVAKISRAAESLEPCALLADACTDQHI